MYEDIKLFHFEGCQFQEKLYALAYKLRTIYI